MVPCAAPCSWLLPLQLRELPGLFASPMPMDFIAQSANTPADQALQARGPDHDIDIAANDPFVTVLGNALQHRNAVGGRSRMCFSSLSGALSGHFFTRDQTVLATALHGASWVVGRGGSE